MSHEKFKPDDLFVNTIKTHPDLNVFIYNSQVYLGKPNFQGENTNVYSTSDEGHLSLYELNIDRTSDLIYPFTDDLQSQFPDRKKYNVLAGQPHSGAPESVTSGQGTYPFSASVSRTLSVPNTGSGTNYHVTSLSNLANNYSYLTPHYQLSSSFLGRDLTTANVNIINFPYVFYGSSLKKGSVKLKYYITGSLIAECADTRNNGELIETTGSNSGSVVGLVLYDQGIMLLTASHDLDSNNGISYDGSTIASASWEYFGAGAFDNISHSSSIASASFAIEAKGTSYTQVLTMLCHAKRGELNNSNNPTSYQFSSSSYETFSSSSYQYLEPQIKQKNIVSSSYSGHQESFDKRTYITKIGIYDENNNLIMIASLANPKRKKEEDEFTFKLTYDI